MISHCLSTSPRQESQRPSRAAPRHAGRVTRRVTAGRVTGTRGDVVTARHVPAPRDAALWPSADAAVAAPLRASPRPPPGSRPRSRRHELPACISRRARRTRPPRSKNDALPRHQSAPLLPAARALSGAERMCLPRLCRAFIVYHCPSPRSVIWPNKNGHCRQQDV